MGNSNNNQDEKQPEGKGMRWWEHYLVRYLLGNIVGAVIVGYYLKEKWGNLGLANNNVIDTSSRLIIIGVLGFAYCYISSVPILVLHACRHIVAKEPDEKKQKHPLESIFFIGGWIIIMSQIFQIFISYWFYFEDLRYSLGWGVMCFFMVLNYWCASLVVRKRESYYELISNLAKKRGQNNNFCESYKHIREHGNAFFIVLYELILAPVFVTLPMEMLPIIVVIWIAPGAMMWWFGSWIEIKFSRDENSQTSHENTNT